ncbi:DapH/DapD/GlmU-related protein [Halorubrum sp. SD626R]|uniref:DapH/DapD/GlmU-related protein n=1 Tax=Halorubrum sp. SD626R TaxID=1419722 RepID=UPI000AA962F3|nr:DapH/DapD/GlmU-related protein [Halorubrum sp. SD626R]TKX82258.1 hypothetical protein EXE53_01225 [Halorubrum sp. SD626R]
MSTNNIRFKNTGREVKSTEIASHLTREHRGKEKLVSGFAPLDEATATKLSFCQEGYEQELLESNAGAVITEVHPDAPVDCALISSSTPQSDFVRAVHDFFIERPLNQSIHPSATISSDATFGDNCVIGPSVTIGPAVTIGDECMLGPGVTIGEKVSIGDRCILGTGTSIGQTGFGYQLTSDDRVMNKPHEGSVVIEDDVHFGVNCSVDRATFQETRIGEGSKIHNLCNFAHNVKIGARNMMSPGCHFAGSSTTGKEVRIHPHVVVGSHTSIGDSAEVGANSTVLDDISEDTLAVGSPARPID